jgi:hypothetical protein
VETNKDKFFGFIYLLISLMIISSCSSGGGSTKPVNDWEEQNLKGKVKSIKESSNRVEVKFGEFIKGEEGLNGGDAFVSYRKFNNQGNLIEEHYTNKDFELIDKKYFSYGDNGELYSIEKKGVYAKNHSIEYYHYDETNKLKVRKSEYPNHNFEDIDSLHYNSDGLLIADNSYRIDADGSISLSSKKVNSYDGNDNLIETKMYFSNGELAFEVKNEYEGGRQIKRIHINYYHNMLSTLLFDKNNLLSERTEQGIRNKKLKLDEDNLILKNKWIYKYEFDAQENWIKQYHYEENAENPSYVVEREIEYY